MSLKGSNDGDGTSQFTLPPACGFVLVLLGGDGDAVVVFLSDCRSSSSLPIGHHQRGNRSHSVSQLLRLHTSLEAHSIKCSMLNAHDDSVIARVPSVGLQPDYVQRRKRGKVGEEGWKRE